MNIGIYYFSGTGNNLAVARELSEELKGNVELIPIAKLQKEKSIQADFDVVGIVYPVWLHYIPPIVEEFLKKLTLSASYVFAIATYFTYPYNSLYDFNTLLEKRGNNLDSGFHIKMPGKYVLLYDLTASDEENESRFFEAKKKIKEIANIVKEKKRIGIEGQIGKDDKDILINHHKNTYKVAEKFWTSDRCDLCGQCEKVCPRDNIYIIGNKVLWKDNCDYCLACLHWCPQAAINNGLSPKCRRYHHPDVSITDIIEQK